MSNTKLGIRVAGPFAGQLSKMRKAAEAYAETPVNVTPHITLLDPNDPGFKIIEDEVTITIIDVGHKSTDDSIVLLRAKVAEGSKEIKTVPVPSNGNADTEVEILCEGDNVDMLVDTVFGDASIVRIYDDNGKKVDLDDLSSILCRLTLPSTTLPISEGEPVDWEDFPATAEEE